MSKRASVLIALALLSCVLAVMLMVWERPMHREQGKAGPRYDIEVILKAKANPPDFWRIVEQGVSMGADEFQARCSITGPTHEKDVERQIELVEEALARGPDAIILAAGDMDLLVPVCERIRRAGIPLIIMDSDINSGAKNSFVGTDNYELGQKMAGLVDSLIGETERFGVVGHVAGTATAVDRSRGFLDSVLNAEARLAGLVYCDGLTEVAHRQTVELLRDNPDIRCMVGLNESSSLGIATALAELGLTGRVKLVACDSSQQQIQYMEDGTLQAVVIQNPYNMGYLSVQAAVQMLQGRRVEPVVNTGCIVITKEDMDTQENQKLLFPFTE